MFPSAAPVILAVARVQRDTGTFRYAFAPTWVFVGAYLLIWTLFGGLSYLGALAASELAQQVPWIMMNAARIGGGILVLAGIYQLTSLKRVCLAKCRAPQDFILHSWGKGYSGSLRMGLKYGIYCLEVTGCSSSFFFPWG
jgi:predicted metal-binding membrane protein